MKIGLVLSGGGTRGIAHIGVARALEERGLRPICIAGTSAGAVVGALYSYGYNYKDMLEFFKNLQLFHITKYALGKPGLFDSEKFYSDIREFLKEDDFSALKKSLTITATNILKGNLKTFQQGELIKPLLASSAFPGVFAPVEINGEYYIDGGALNNFPVEFIDPECDLVIGSYVNSIDSISIDDLKYSYHVVERALKLKTFNEDYKKFSRCNLVIYPEELSKYGTFDRKHLDTIFEIGYKAANQALENFDQI